MAPTSYPQASSSRSSASGGAIDPEVLAAEAAKGHDIFTDPAIARAATEDPLFRYLSKSWRQVVVVVAAVLFGSFAWQRFSETREERIGDYASLYGRAGQQLESLQDASKKLAELKTSLLAMDDESRKKLQEAEQTMNDAKARLDDTLKSLGDTAAPYTTIAVLYQGLAQLAVGDKPKALETLGGLGDWKSAEASGSGMRFAAELAALTRARVLLDEPDKFDQGWKLLKELSQASDYAAASAASTLLRVASTAEQRAEAKEIADQLQNDHPEFSETLKQAASGN